MKNINEELLQWNDNAITFDVKNECFRFYVTINFVLYIFPLKKQSRY